MKKPARPSAEDDGAVAVPALLNDAAVDAAAPKDLRTAYRELRAAYVALHERHHERITEALADRKEDGKKIGGDVPYGYRLAEDNETLVEDEAEQAVIAEAVQLREQGLALRRVAQELWKKKMRPRPVPKERRRGTLKTKRFGMFDPTQIRRMRPTRHARSRLTDVECLHAHGVRERLAGAPS